MIATITATATDLVAGYGTNAVLGPVNVTLRPGVTALLGRNGSGKTTLMRTLCGIIPPLGGTCEVLGSAVADGATVRSRIGYLGHESALATALTVAQNLRFWVDLTSTYPDATLIPHDELVARFDLSRYLLRAPMMRGAGRQARHD